MSGVCTSCNAPVEEEGKELCPDCDMEGGSEEKEEPPFAGESEE